MIDMRNQQCIYNWILTFAILVGVSLTISYSAEFLEQVWFVKLIFNGAVVVYTFYTPSLV